MIRREIVLGTVGFIGGAFAVGVAVNGLLDYLSPSPKVVIEVSAATTPTMPTIRLARANAAVEQSVELKPSVAESNPTDIKTIIVRTIPVAPQRPQPALPYAGEIANARQPMPAIVYSGVKATDVTASVQRPTPKPAGPTPVSRTQPSEDSEPFSPAQIARVKTALRLTPEQEAHWPAVEAELRAIAKLLPKKVDSKKQSKIAIQPDSADRLRWAATPLIMSLREDQKQTARFIARSMGLEEVASAL